MSSEELQRAVGGATRLWSRTVVYCAFSMLVGACSDAPPRLGASEERIIYGADDRVEYYDVTDPIQQSRMVRSTVALIANEWLNVDGLSEAAPSWGTAAGLCPGERFAEQPSVAFCTGVLIDWDLVLTAGHCLRALALDDFSVVFGYYYAQAGQLAITADDILEPSAIVSEGLSDDGAPQFLDYGWIRLSKPVAQGRGEPVPLYAQLPALNVGDAVVSMGAASGLPLKLDAASTVRAVSEADDFFVTNTDDSAGWSGGGVFDTQGVLLGILATGGLDLVTTPDGCRASFETSDTDTAQEQVMYASRATAALCADESAASICRHDCAEPCQASTRPPTPLAPVSGCTLIGRSATGNGEWGGCLGLLAVFSLTRHHGCRLRQRRRRACSRSLSPWSRFAWIWAICTTAN